MKKGFFIFIGGGLIGVAVGFAVAIFVYPYIFLSDVVATEARPNETGNPIIATGTFIHANPADPVHHGKGGLTAFRDTIHLHEDFEVGPGPKYKVYLVEAADITRSSDVKESTFFDLGALRAFKGSQNYDVPAGINVSDYKSVVIWCEAFGVLISPATLKFGGS